MTRLRVGILAQQEWTGGEIYTLNLVRALRQLPDDERPEIVLIHSSGLDDHDGLIALSDDHVSFRTPLSRSRPHAWRRGARTILPRAVKRALGESRPELAWAARTARVDVVFPLRYSSHSLTPRGISWIPDLQHRFLPHLFAKTERDARDWEMRRMLSGRGDVVFSSESALADALTCFGPPAASLHVLRFASVPDVSWYSDSREVVARYGIPEHFFMACNQFWAHKGHETLFQALALLRRLGVHIRLVCTGPTDDYRNPGFFGQLLERIRELGIENQLSILGKIPRRDQMVLMREASAVIQPSIFEGWSTVLEDARSVDTPVIASDLPVHFEQAVAGAIYFRRKDAEDCARAIMDHLARTRSELPNPQVQTERVTAFARAFMNIVNRSSVDRHRSLPLSQTFPAHPGVTRRV
jgi:glycosyltransferase involved in cell wall biosynthesis